MPPALSGESLLELYFVDVGQGDGVLIKKPGFRHLMIDGGFPRSTQDTGIQGPQRLSPIRSSAIISPSINRSKGGRAGRMKGGLAEFVGGDAADAELRGSNESRQLQQQMVLI